QRTAQLIVQVAGGKVAAAVVDIYPKKPAKEQVTLRLSRLKKLLGIEIPQQQTVEILKRLGFQPDRQGDSVVCCVPTWRSDVYREADLIEEVARVYGYGKIPTEKKIKIEVARVDSRQKLVDSIETYLNGCGFYETINVTFLDESPADIFATDKSRKHLTVRDESRKSANLLRQSLLPSLFDVIRTNVNAQNSPCRFFEIADTFVLSAKQNAPLPDENTKLALTCDSDFRELRGIIEGLVESLNRNAKISFESIDLPWAKVGSQVLVEKAVIGYAGIASQQAKDKFDLGEIELCAAELDFDLLSNLQIGVVKLEPIPRFPAIDRDLSLVVDESVTWADIIKAIDKKASRQLKDVSFVDIYRGKTVSAGKKSVTLSLRFRDEDGTLTHKIVDDLEASILQSLIKSVGAELRTI
ncbi:MAG: phenylalanine--tRNA ligase subunit beta-related protein, partial [Planctomycetota bacterium]